MARDDSRSFFVCHAVKQNQSRQIEATRTSRKYRLRLAVAGLTLLAGGCVAPLRDSAPRSKTAETPVYGATAARQAREPRISQLPRSIHDKIPQAAPASAKPYETRASFYQPAGHADVIRGASESIVPGEPMTIDQVMNYTLDHHPRLKARAAEVEVARGALIGAGLLLNPEFVMQTDSPTAVVGGDSTLSTRLTFPFQTAGKRHKNQEVARVAIRRACFTLGLETQTVLLEAAAAALEVQYLQELVEVQQHIADLANVAAEVQKNKTDAGVVTEVQSLISQVDAADVQFDRLKTQAQLEAARLRLSRAVGMIPPQPLAVAGKMVIEPTGNLPLDDLLAVAYEVRPELGRARTAVAESERQLILDRAKAVPDVEIGPQFRDNLSGSGDEIGARLQFDVPLFNRNQGDIAATTAQIQANLALLRDTELTTLSDVAAAYQQLAPLEEGLDYYGTKILPLAEKTEVAIQSVQKVELIDPFLLTTQLRRLASMRINEVSMRYTHNQIRMRLELYLGRRLDELALQSVTPAAPQRGAKTGPKPLPAPRGGVAKPGDPAEKPNDILPDMLPDDPTGMPVEEPVEEPAEEPLEESGAEPGLEPFEDEALPETVE